MDHFFERPIVQILKELNAKNASTLKRDLVEGDLVFTEVSSNPITGAREVNAAPASGTGYFGVLRDPGVTYNRYVGGLMFHIYPRVVVPAETTFVDIINKVAEIYNLPAFEIEPEAGDPTGTYDFGKEVHGRIYPGGEGEFTVQISADPRSIGWVGQFPIIVYDAAYDLGTIVTKRDLDALIYPDDTKGDTGSMSTLSYPVKFTLSSDAKVTLGTVGNKLSTDVDDPLVAALIAQIKEYYVNANDPTAINTIDLIIPGSTVVISTLPATGETQVVLDTVVAEGASYIGKLYINNPVFIDRSVDISTFLPDFDADVALAAPEGDRARSGTIIVSGNEKTFSPFQYGGPMMQYYSNTFTGAGRDEYMTGLADHKLIPADPISHITPASIVDGTSYIEFPVEPNSDYHGSVKMTFKVPTRDNDSKAFAIAFIDDGDIRALSPSSDIPVADLPAGIAAVIGAHFLRYDGTLFPDVQVGGGPGLLTYTTPSLPGYVLYSFRADGEGV